LEAEALILDDSAASSYDSSASDSRSPSPAAQECTWTTYQNTRQHSDFVPQQRSVALGMTGSDHVIAADAEANIIQGDRHLLPMYHQPLCNRNRGDAATLPRNAGEKRTYPVNFDSDPFGGRRSKSARISSKRQDQIYMGTAASPALEVLVAVPVALKTECASNKAQPQPSVSFSARPSATHSICKTTILQCCKFTSKQTQQACKGQLSIVTHKRGHLAVACSSRHQWVWCDLCCTCNSAKGSNSDKRQRGCTVSTHWYERDAFDTGSRNHMNVHKVTNK